MHNEPAAGRGFKQRFSQQVARKLEGWVTRNADIIFSVSEGINENLRRRHPGLTGKPIFAVPYGAEPADFNGFKKDSDSPARGKLLIRYIGAVWNDCYPVLDALMPALAAVNEELPISLEFYGTSYAGEGLAKNALDNWIEKNQMQAYTREQCLRVSYEGAIDLTMNADILFLMGGMQPYYAASKLMGLIVSGKPFVAFVHQDSFPAIFLKKLEYRYLVTYTAEENDLPVKKIAELKNSFLELAMNKDTFRPPDLDHPLIQENTAFGMTKFFADNISTIL